MHGSNILGEYLSVLAVDHSVMAYLFRFHLKIIEHLPFSTPTKSRQITKELHTSKASIANTKCCKQQQQRYEQDSDVELISVVINERLNSLHVLYSLQNGQYAVSNGGGYPSHLHVIFFH
jgi:hypothetical protein